MMILLHIFVATDQFIGYSVFMAVILNGFLMFMSGNV